MKKMIPVLCLLFFPIHLLVCQEMWINAMPFHYHPSFAGNIGQPRFAAASALRFGNNDSYINSMFKINHNYLSYDNFIAKLSSGIGVQINYSYEHNYSNRGLLLNGSHLEGKFVIAPKLSWAGRYTLSPSIQYSNSSESFNQQTYNDPETYPSDSLDFTSLIKPKAVNDLQLGLLFNSPGFFAGISASLLSNERSHSIVNQRDFTFLIGCQIGKQGVTRFTFTPVVYFRNFLNPYYKVSYSFPHSSLGGFTQLENPFLKSYAIISATLTYKKVMVGLDLWSNLMLGYTIRNLKIMLVAQLAEDYFENSHTLQASFRYTIGKPSNKLQ